MPTYEYECSACGHEFEQFESIKALPTKNCPKCGRSKAKRLISGGGGLIFKGSGFYCTDYRRGAHAPSPKDSKPSENKCCAAAAGSCENAKAKGECPATAGKA